LHFTEVPIEPTLSFLVSVIATAWVYTQAWLERRERFMGWWALGWVLHAVRFSSLLYAGPPGMLPAALPVSIVRDLCLLQGAAAFAGRQRWRWLGLIAALELAGVAASLTVAPALADALPYLRLGVAVFTWSFVAVALLRGPRETLRYNRMAAVGYACFALDAALALAGFRGAAPYLLDVLSALLAGLGVSLMVLESASRQRRAALATVSASMAQVVQSRALVCSGCRRIESEKKEWRRAEEFVSLRTNADISHGICPDCFTEHYGDLFAGEPLP
jgi:hypothetical protein